MISYFNYRNVVADSSLARRSWVHKWWQIYEDDRHWVPPHYPTLRQEIEPSHNSHIARMSPAFIHTEALPESRRMEPTTPKAYQGMAASGPLFEVPLAAGIGLCDQPRGKGISYLALLHCANDRGSLQRLLEALSEELRAGGCRRIVAPIGLSPHLGAGILQDHWSDLPPLYTPYNPPYLPDVARGILEPIAESRLYHLQVARDPPCALSSPAQLEPFEPARLTSDLLPLLQEACSPWSDHFPAPDQEEAVFLLRWIGQWPLQGWLAVAEGDPVGFVLLQADQAHLMQRIGGARRLIARLWLQIAGGQPTRRGRLLFGAVSPEWRGRGVGCQLLRQVLATANERGWSSLSIGPFPTEADACGFLEGHGAEPRQSYKLYQTKLRVSAPSYFL